MHQKVMAVAFVAFICALFIACAGCTSIKEGPPTPATQTPAVNETHALVATPVVTLPIKSEATAVSTLLPSDEMVDRNGTLDRDAEFNAFYVKSGEEIVNKTVLVIDAMAPGSAAVQLVYSPAMLYLRAEDLGITTESYYEQALTMKASTPENEEKRIAYIQFLVPAKDAAYHIADAAEAESFGDYQYAFTMATAAKADLWNIEVNPALPPTSPYNTLNVFLSEYMGRLYDEVIQQQKSEIIQRSQTGDRFPLRRP